VNASDIDWEAILPEPFVLTLLGARGEGKTALSHRLLEVFEDDDRDAYIMGFPESKADELPEWLEILPVGTSREAWPEDSIVYIHEAHQIAHARRSMNQESLELDKLITVSRHKNSNIIYDTQQSHRLDKNSVAAVDAIICRWPALMQEDFERRAVRPIIEDAREALSKYVNVHEEEDFTFVDRETDANGVDLLKKHVYVHADQFRGEYPHEVELAEHWSEELSKVYGESGSGPGGSRDIKSLDDIREDMAEPSEVEDKSVEEIDDILAEAGIEDATEAAAEMVDAPDEQDGGDDGPDAEALGMARDLIRQLKDRDSRVISNDFPRPIVEIVVPETIEDETYELVKEYRTRPGDEKRAIPVPPSTKDGYPEASEALVGFQFALDEMNTDALDSSGYDLEAIFEALEDEPAIATKNTLVEASLPWE
jgi:hypothetical protein